MSIFNVSEKANNILKRQEKFGTNKRNTFPIVLNSGNGVRITDVDQKTYLDFNTAYSAISFGYGNSRLIKKMKEQSEKMTMCSFSFNHDKKADLLEKLCKISGHDKALIMSTGTEAVESAIKIARRFGYKKKGITIEDAEIISMDGNFHGRTYGSLSLSTNPLYMESFGPFLKGVKSAKYGDIDCVKKLINKNTCAVIIEPIQGEGGVNIPPHGYLKNLENLCREHGVLLILDEIQCGLGRTGYFTYSSSEGVKGDLVTFGKALGGGIVPCSALVGRYDVMSCFTPGSHGSTFGGNPLACVIACEVLDMLEGEGLLESSRTLGAFLLERLKEIESPYIKEIRGRGLFVGIEIDTTKISATHVASKLVCNGVLVKETRGKTIRIVPPIIITKDELIEGIDIIKKTFEDLSKES